MKFIGGIGMGKKVKVAMAQMTSKLGDIEYNLKKAEDFIKQAAAKGADIICFPELFATGYNMNILKDNIIDLSRKYYQIIFNRMSQLAKNNQIYLITSFVELIDDEKPYITAIIFDRDGRKVGSFYKTHLFNLEKKYFEKGREYPVFDVDFGKVGILICYDIGFPEAARTLCLKGAEIIFVPSAWRIQDENAWMLNIPSRALENQLFTVGVNRSGREGDLHLFGRSMVCNPMGEIVFQMDYDDDKVSIYDIDLDEIKKSRKWGYLKDRRPEIYQL